MAGPAKYPFVVLDVFTATRFEGNPLAIVLVPSSSTLTQSQRQSIASEFNLSETVIFYASDPASGGSSPGDFPIAIHTLTREIPFAGHPSVGSASWLLVHRPKDEQAARPAEALLATLAGLRIPISRAPEFGENHVKLVIPQDRHEHAKWFPLDKLLELHPSLTPFLETQQKNENGFPIVSIVKGMTAVQVPLPSVEALARASTASGPAWIPATSARNGGYLDDGWDHDGPVAVYMYVPNVEDQDLKTRVIRSRMFYMSREDPATGSAAAGLVTTLALRGDRSVTESTFTIVQGVEMGRRSVMGFKVTLAQGGEDKGNGISKVELSGQTVFVSEGWVSV